MSNWKVKNVKKIFLRIPSMPVARLSRAAARQLNFNAYTVFQESNAFHWFHLFM